MNGVGELKGADLLRIEGSAGGEEADEIEASFPGMQAAAMRSA